ncbi:MAG: hypothetical protein KatS3mg076_1732 [Candidatus Binatia bacterium]|nr:MAG: hypothetical protein KatS3mg076_1732 [Candidatus Binatia bacterium]
MPRYHATVRLLEVDAADPATARRELEEKLSQSQLGRWQLLRLEPEASPLPLRHARGRLSRRASNLGPLLVIGALVWALWFYWLLLG